jgi:hypothetical protein
METKIVTKSKHHTLDLVYFAWKAMLQFILRFHAIDQCRMEWNGPSM